MNGFSEAPTYQSSESLDVNIQPSSILEAALEATADGILVIDNFGKIIRFNENFARLWRLPKEILDTKDDDKALAFVLDQLANPKAFIEKVRILYSTPDAESFDILEFKDGRVFERHSRPLKCGKSYLGRVWSFRDISVLRQTAALLQEANNDLKSIMSSISDYLWSVLVDKEGNFRYRYYSPVIKKITGRPAEFYAEGPHKWLSTVHPDDRPSLMSLIDRLKSRQSNYEEIEYRILMPEDGSTKWVRDSIQATHLPFNGSMRLDGVVSDITERKNLEIKKEMLRRREGELLLEAQRSVQTRNIFISVASHELRTPLTSLKLQLDLLAKTLDAPDNTIVNPKQLAESSKKEVSRLTGLIDVLLDISKISNGRLTIEAQQMDLSTTVKELLKRHKPALEESGCDLLANIDENIWGTWDKIRIEQVLTNLLLNAIKFGKRNPIEVSLQSDSKHVILAVKDYGIGIPEEKQAKIFEPFERAVSSKSFSGMGLGLYIASQIVQAHDGSIEVKSEPGKYTKFAVRLPKTKFCGKH